MWKKKNPGFTLIEIMIILLIIGILVAMAFPNFQHARRITRKSICMNNLRQIESALGRWALENEITTGTTLTEAEEDEIYSQFLRGGEPECPSDGTYTINPIGSTPQVTCDAEGHEFAEEE